MIKKSNNVSVTLWKSEEEENKVMKAEEIEFTSSKITEELRIISGLELVLDKKTLSKEIMSLAFSDNSKISIFRSLTSLENLSIFA